MAKHEPRYQRAIMLNEAENAQVTELQEKGIKVIDIFRAGIKTLSTQKE